MPSNPAPKNPPVKGKPMGIPVWGWVIAAVLGIVIGYTILKQSGKGSSSSSSGDSGGSGTGLPVEGEPGASGSITVPMEQLLQALGLRSSGTVTSGETGGNGESSAATSNNGLANETSSATESAIQSSQQESISDPIVQNLVNQGLVIAPEGTTIFDQATQRTYDVSGTPEFSPGNYNPNSPQGVLAMNQANQQLGLWSTNTNNVAMPGSVPMAPQPTPYTPLITEFPESRPAENPIPNTGFINPDFSSPMIPATPTYEPPSQPAYSPPPTVYPESRPAANPIAGAGAIAA